MRIVNLSEPVSPSSGEIEVDESYFGAKCISGKRGCGAVGKTIMFGLLKRDGNVYTEILPAASMKTLEAFIRNKMDIHSIIHLDEKIDIGHSKHYKVHYG